MREFSCTDIGSYSASGRKEPPTGVCAGHAGPKILGLSRLFAAGDAGDELGDLGRVLALKQVGRHGAVTET